MSTPAPPAYMEFPTPSPSDVKAPPVVLRWDGEQGPGQEYDPSSRRAPMYRSSMPSHKAPTPPPAVEPESGPSSRRDPMYRSSMPIHKAPTPPPAVPSTPVVAYDPVPLQITTRKQARKFVCASAHSVPSITNIVGTYLSNKTNNEVTRINRGVSGEYSRSRPEVQMYNHVMHKLETLSCDVYNTRGTDQANWAQAFGPFRRQMFNDLYRANDMVRLFAREIAGAPMHLPQLDKWALGIKRTNWTYPRAAIQAPNRGASLELLGLVRTVVLVDDSGSMSEPGHSAWSTNSDWRYAFGSRWQQAADVVVGMVPKIAQYSRLGTDVMFLNREGYFPNLRTEAEARALFDSQPWGGTPTGQRVNDFLDAYMSTLRYDRSLMPLNLIVITDGEANDEELLHWCIEEHVTKIMHRGYQAHQIGAEFVQVGDCERAMRSLERLEEEVSRHHGMYQRDVVGVTPINRVGRMNSDVMLAIAISGIDARLNGYMRRRGVNI
ncbi:hypothetical protein FA95DRAFT_1558197 [Auriscalpium vulgare]|uniref:Uncharacterized protein n=1 Tax=Auriscalpium vulgare TaxID=40419 RepID=A0ACB8RWA7_9AGAM|nr:hypothetical protein FA95DRAFT_1558197 [Auriscalpium vulgare]